MGVVAHGGVKGFDSVLKVFKEADMAEERVRALRGLGYAREPELIDRLLQMTLTIRSVRRMSFMSMAPWLGTGMQWTAHGSLSRPTGRPSARCSLRANSSSAVSSNRPRPPLLQRPRRQRWRPFSRTRIPLGLNAPSRRRLRPFVSMPSGSNGIAPSSRPGLHLTFELLTAHELVHNP